MKVFVGVNVVVGVGKGGTVKETVGVISEVHVGSKVLVGRGVKVKVGVMVAVGGTGVAVLEGMTTISGRTGVGKIVLQAVVSNIHPRTTRLQSFFILLFGA
jgi:hypothetical protein